MVTTYFMLIMYGTTVLFDPSHPLTFYECFDIGTSWRDNHDVMTKEHGRAVCLSADTAAAYKIEQEWTW